MDLDELAENDYIVILNYYTDEPSISGFPPYLAPLPRYVHGTLHDLDKQSQYFTIEKARTSPVLFPIFNVCHPLFLKGEILCCFK